MNQNCIDACLGRFGSRKGAAYLKNDGKDLSMIANKSIDFIFSFDSLVHCDLDIMEAYVSQLRRILKPNGFAFIHHSNLGQYFKNGRRVKNVHWRAENVSGNDMIELCIKNGLYCVSQERVQWASTTLNDAFSIISHRHVSDRRETIVFENYGFIEERENICRLSSLYHPAAK